MKKIFVVMLIVLMTVVLFDSCSKNAVVEPPLKEQPKVDQVTEAQPQTERPQLTEEELFQRRTLEEVNRMGYLKMINFEFDKYVIADDMKDILARNAEWLQKQPAVTINIEGHCDERGTVEYNMALGEKRAESARKYLMDLGVSGDRIQTVSYGKSKPLVQGVDDASYYQNRRCEFIITKK